MFEWWRWKRKRPEQEKPDRKDPERIPTKVETELLKLSLELGEPVERLTEKYQAITTEGSP
jgi:hypothetical protein